jgi:hypothetical protein
MLQEIKNDPNSRHYALPLGGFSVKGAASDEETSLALKIAGDIDARKAQIAANE